MSGRSNKGGRDMENDPNKQAAQDTSDSKPLSLIKFKHPKGVSFNGKGLQDARDSSTQEALLNA